LTNLFSPKTVTQYVPVAPNVAPPTPVPLPAAPTTPPPVAPTVSAPAKAPVTAQVNQAAQQAVQTIGQRAGRSSTVLTTRPVRGNYSSGSGGTIADSSSSSASPYAAKTLG